MPALIQAFQNQSLDVRGVAVNALGQIGTPEAIDAVPELAIALRDRKESVYLSVAQALDKIKKFLPEATDGEDFDF